LCGGRIFLGEDKNYNVVGRGSIHIIYTDGRIRYFHNVRPTPGLKRNLLSVSQFTSAEVGALFTRNMCNPMRSALALAKGISLGTLYILDMTTCVKVKTNAATTKKRQSFKKASKAC
jgi:hypothetical protein